MPLSNSLKNSKLKDEKVVNPPRKPTVINTLIFSLIFNLTKINPNISLVSDEAFERVSMKDKKYEKVRRENLIVKSKDFSVKAGGF